MFPLLLIHVVIGAPPCDVNFFDIFASDSLTEHQQRQQLSDIAGTEPLIRILDRRKDKTAAWEALLTEDQALDDRFVSLTGEISVQNSPWLVDEAVTLVRQVFANLEDEIEIRFDFHHILIGLFQEARRLGFKDVTEIELRIASHAQLLVRVYRHPQDDEFLGPQITNALEMEKELITLTQRHYLPFVI